MKTRPIGDQIMVQPFPSDEISEGGIIIPENARARSCKATVMAVGGGTKNRPMRYSEGDIVFHVKDAGTEIVEDGMAYYLMSQVDVLCTLVGEAEVSTAAPIRMWVRDKTLTVSK